MKNITRSTDIKMTTGWRMIMALLVLTAVSCSEDFLERKPKGQLTYDTFFRSKRQEKTTTKSYFIIKKGDCENNLLFLFLTIPFSIKLT